MLLLQVPGMDRMDAERTNERDTPEVWVAFWNVPPCPPPCPQAARPRPGRATTAAKERRRSVARKHSRATDRRTDCGGRDFIAFNLRYSHSSAARPKQQNAWRGQSSFHDIPRPFSVLKNIPASRVLAELCKEQGGCRTKTRVETGKFRHNRFQARIFLSSSSRIASEGGSKRPPLTSSWKGRNYAARTAAAPPRSALLFMGLNAIASTDPQCGPWPCPSMRSRQANTFYFHFT